MAYQSLYRKYRPDTFKGVIGQEHICTTLVNQIRTGTIAHAYLLTGTRGTGKTSVARIFARAINCLSPIDGSPCGECEVCKKLKDTTNLDVVEIDAASNNSVDDARAIRDSVRYAPVDCKYKVYIIDEVHQLSTAAFNALLKTLEEPPRHAVFILATTEVQKIPATIMSRCLRLDFHLIPQETLEKHVASIFDKEGIKYTSEGVSAIARAGEGSVRDTLSIADMCISYSENIDYECVLGVLGANDPSIIAKIAFYTLSGNLKSALSAVEEVASLGKSMSILAKDLAHYFRDLMVIKHDNEANKYLKLPDKLFDTAKTIADGNRDAVILRALDIFSSVETNQRYSTSPKILLETAIIKCATLSGEDYTDILARISALETKLNDLSLSPANKTDFSALKNVLTPVKAEDKEPMEEKTEPVQQSEPMQQTENKQTDIDLHEAVDLPFEIEKESAPKIQAPVAKQKNSPSVDTQTIISKEMRDMIIKLRGKIVQRLRADKQLMLCLSIGDNTTLLKVENGALVLAFAKENDMNYCQSPNTIAYLKNIISQEIGFDCDLKLCNYDQNSKTGLSNAELASLFASADTLVIKNNTRR